jgi:hypothetical protein
VLAVVRLLLAVAPPALTQYSAAAAAVAAVGEALMWQLVLLLVLA